MDALGPALAMILRFAPPRSPTMNHHPRAALLIGLLLAITSAALADGPLTGTDPLNIDRPLDVLMVEGIDRFALREIKLARPSRESLWARDYTSANAYQSKLAPNRERFREIIGAVDARGDARGRELVGTTTQDSLITENDLLSIHAVRWPVLEGVSAEGLFLKPKKPPIARFVAIPDAGWTPEMISGIESCDTAFALDLASMGCEVLVPTLISRDDTFSTNPEIGRVTNQPHREFVYRQAFELGRHVIGYEVQKILAAVDQFELRGSGESSPLPIGVAGVSEGGLLALYSAALDPRIDAALVSGYFDSRERVWREPIYRNVWRLLQEFGDAEMAGMIAPRQLWIEASPAIVEIDGPPKERAGRRGAAPGVIRRPDHESVLKELGRARAHWSELGVGDAVGTVGTEGDPPLKTAVVAAMLENLTDQTVEPNTTHVGPDSRSQFSDEARQQRQLGELVDFTQRLLSLSHRKREKLFAPGDRPSVQAWTESAKDLREHVYRELIGKLPHDTVAPRPRSRQILDEPKFVGYEVVLDVFPDVIAGGVLLLPKDLAPNERRPVVVCQHGLEGTPMDTILGPESKGYRAYKSFSAELARQGFVVYAPQNPYRGLDAFRTLQRKSNPLGRSLFSYITPQHLVTLRWLATLPYVDPDRIGFYGLSYGGKTAVRVPPLLAPADTEPGYCLSICSADFNEWVAKNASVDARFSYLWTGEYEIFEWNMGHVANYAELSMLMAPRPFMVERGHDDGVGIDEWVAWEFAKVRRHYTKLGIEDRTEIEFFDGPHTINGKGTFHFLHKHLQWP
jgi:dienelactone hydrolase